MSTFILASGDPPPSDPLNLLPFALTPLPPHAAIGTYFRPRPGPNNSSVAAFRGRQVVGQSIAVPPGYRGVVLRVPPAGAPGIRPSGGPGVLTPATSFASASASGTKSRQSTPAQLDASASASESASPRAQRAAARARGSGQVAVARARTRRAAAPRKRIRLDESDEEDGDVVTPMKRAEPSRSGREPSGVGRVEREREGEDEREGKGEGQVGLVTAVPIEGEGDMDVDEGAPEIVLAPAPAPSTSAPAPAHASASVTAAAVAADTRVLVPTASFGSIVLWTADAPLAGFDPDELGGAGNGRVKAEDTKSSEAETDAADTTEMSAAATTATTDAATTDATTADTRAADAPDGSKPDAATAVTALERGWWRTGGAGEGGDEFVRALGEWLGLGEVIHKPLYADDDDDE